MSLCFFEVFVNYNFHSHLFLCYEGWFPRDGFLIEKEQIDKIRHLPTVIVQGRYDVVCPCVSAYDLKQVRTVLYWIVLYYAARISDTHFSIFLSIYFYCTGVVFSYQFFYISVFFLHSPLNSLLLLIILRYVFIRQAFPEADLKITLAGHSGMEKENIRELVAATEKFKLKWKNDELKTQNCIKRFFTSFYHKGKKIIIVNKINIKY